MTRSPKPSWWNALSSGEIAEFTEIPLSTVQIPLQILHPRSHVLQLEHVTGVAVSVPGRPGDEQQEIVELALATASILETGPRTLDSLMEFSRSFSPFILLSLGLCLVGGAGFGIRVRIADRTPRRRRTGAGCLFELIEQAGLLGGGNLQCADV